MANSGPRRVGEAKNANATEDESANQDFARNADDKKAGQLEEAPATYVHPLPESLERWLAFVQRVRSSVFHGAVPGTNRLLRWLSATAGSLFTLVALFFGRLSRTGTLSLFFEYVTEVTPWNALLIFLILSLTALLGLIVSESMPLRMSYLTIMGRGVVVTLVFWAIASVVLWN